MKLLQYRKGRCRAVRHFVRPARALLFLLAVPLFNQAQTPAAPSPLPDNARPSDPARVDLNALTLEELMQVLVVGAALHPQTLQDAPASVTVISAEDIRKYGYRTLGEALASVRGFYLSNDRSYETMGVRGFSLPGDYSSHLLVMVNGHNMADNVFDYMLYFGNDFPIDMNLIKQIEVIRGPSSALYGSNAILATINIITRSPGEAGPLTVTADTGSFGEKKIQISDTASLGTARMLFSGSVFNNAGESPLYFPQFNTPQNNNGKAINMTTERGYHFFSTLVWRNWTVTTAVAGHDMISPINWGPVIFNDRGSQNADNRDFIDAVYARQVGDGVLEWRTYYDSFHYQGRADYQLESAVEDNRTDILGNWVGSKLTYRVPVAFAGDLTVGVEGKFDVRNIMESFDVSPVPTLYLRTSNPNRSLGLIFQDEKRLSQKWKLDLGLRFDATHYGDNFLSPRVALIYQPSSWAVKFLYGRGFRNPSAFQLFYSDGLAAQGNPNAHAESADTVEFDLERKLGKRMNVQASAYGYRMRNFLEGLALPDGLIEYQNAGTIQAEGIEFEISGRPTHWFETTASYSLQRSRLTGNEILQNSPSQLGKVRFAVPLGRRFDLSSGIQTESSALTLAGNRLPALYLADFTITSSRLLRNFDVRVGLRNAFNRNYADPIALNPVVDSMPQPGRSVFVELIAHLPTQELAAASKR
jgi:outer membrane receptor for ferrienterochelin and colicins